MAQEGMPCVTIHLTGKFCRLSLGGLSVRDRSTCGPCISPATDGLEKIKKNFDIGVKGFCEFCSWIDNNESFGILYFLALERRCGLNRSHGI